MKQHSEIHEAAKQEQPPVAKALETYVVWHGPIHDDDCPADDTCDCAYKWVNDGVNEAVRRLSASEAAAPQKEQEPR